MKEQLPRGIRNNNPGNIRHGANWLGLNPNGRNIDSAFCVFESPFFGIRALAKAVVRMENGIQPYSDETIQKGIDLCFD